MPFNGIIEGENKKEGMKNFTAPSGMNSIVKHFLNSSGKCKYYLNSAQGGDCYFLKVEESELLHQYFMAQFCCPICASFAEFA